MTHVFAGMLLLVAFYALCEWMVAWTERPSCPLCGGKTHHRAGCEWGDH